MSLTSKRVEPLKRLSFSSALTFQRFSALMCVLTDHCSRKMIRAFVRSYGESSTETLSPGTIRMKCLRIFPEMCARTLRWPGRSTRNIVPGKTCVTVPSVMICSSFAIARRIYAPCHATQDYGIRDANMAGEQHAWKIVYVAIQRNCSSESVGKYSRSSSRFHHAPLWRSSSTVVNRYR